MKRILRLTVNGREYEVAVSPHRTLLKVLREELNLSGAKEGCDLGSCGACTVIIDGKPVLSCLTLALSCEGKEILTIEGISSEGKLHPLQENFMKYGAVQCGYCTPGMIMSAKALLDENPNPSELDARRAISGNLCRCTGYVKIVEAVLATKG
ncbi:MAG: (2Fe-2S)-binding protein [Syntrophales bacterium]|nr:(2Fe-2S)-binding protein [Syntrophales bacterium]